VCKKFLGCGTKARRVGEWWTMYYDSLALISQYVTFCDSKFSGFCVACLKKNWVLGCSDVS